MPPRCSICTHPNREAIDASILDGGSLRNVAQQHGLHFSAVNRHRPHVAARLAKRDAEHTYSLQERLAKGHRVIDKVLESPDEELRLKAIDRLAKLLELEHGTKSKVEQTTRSAAEPKTREEQLAGLAELKAEIAETERNLKGGAH